MLFLPYKEKSGFKPVCLVVIVLLLWRIRRHPRRFLRLHRRGAIIVVQEVALFVRKILYAGLFEASSRMRSGLRADFPPEPGLCSGGKQLAKLSFNLLLIIGNGVFERDRV